MVQEVEHVPAELQIDIFAKLNVLAQSEVHRPGGGVPKDAICRVARPDSDSCGGTYGYGNERAAVDVLHRAAGDTSSGTPQDAYNARPDYGLSSVHRTHLLNVNYVYELPFFRKAANGVMRNVLGGWELAGVTTYQSGAPNSVSVPSDVARIGASSSRASVIGNPNLPSGQRTLARWFNTEAFLPPERMVQGRFGDSGRNILIGPGFSQWDLSIIKSFHLREKAMLQFRAESFNFPNHPSFTGIDTTVRFTGAGQPAQTYGAVTGSGPARVFEFGLKLLF